MQGTLQYQPTGEDVREAYALHMARGSPAKLVMLMGIGLAVAVLSLALIEPSNLGTVGELLRSILIVLVVLLAGLLAIYAVTIYVWLPRFARRVFAQHKELRGLTEFRWDGAELLVNNVIGSNRLAWSDFHAWKRGETMLLLYRSEAMFSFLPTAKPEFAKAADEMQIRLTAAGVKRKR